MRYTSKSFAPVSLTTFSKWVNSQPLYTAEIVRLERWKFLSKLAFWHEFVIVYISPFSDVRAFAPEEVLPALLAKGAAPRVYKDTVQQGLMIRFDRRMPDDFACFVTPSDKIDIEHQSYLVDTLTRTPGFGVEPAYRGPTLGDVVFLLEMFHGLAPSYNLFKRNCWTFAFAAMSELSQCFAADLTYEFSETLEGDKRVHFKKLRSKLNNRFGGASPIPSIAREGEFLSVNTLDHIAKAKAVVADELSAAWQATGDSIKAGEVKKFKSLKARYDLQSPDATEEDISLNNTTHRTIVPLSRHPFRGYVRQIISTSIQDKGVFDMIRLVEMFHQLSRRPEWQDEVLQSGVDVTITQCIGKVLRTALQSGISFLAVDVISPFIEFFISQVPFFGEKEQEIRRIQIQDAKRAAQIQELFFKPCEFISLLVEAIQYPKTEWLLDINPLPGFTVQARALKLLSSMVEDKSIHCLMPQHVLTPCLMSIIGDERHSNHREIELAMLLSSGLYQKNRLDSNLHNPRADTDGPEYIPHRLASYNAAFSHIEIPKNQAATVKTAALMTISTLAYYPCVHDLAKEHIPKFAHLIRIYSEDPYLLFQLGRILNIILGRNPHDPRQQAPERTEAFLDANGLQNQLAIIELSHQNRIGARTPSLIPYLKLLWRYEHPLRVAEGLVDQDLRGVRVLLGLLDHESKEIRGWIIGILLKYKFHALFMQALIESDVGTRVDYLIENELILPEARSAASKLSFHIQLAANRISVVDSSMAASLGPNAIMMQILAGMYQARERNPVLAPRENEV